MRTIENEARTFHEEDALFLPREVLEEQLRKTGTPLFVYDEKGLRLGAKSLLAKFAGDAPANISFPVRSCPRRQVLEILAETGMSAYCLTEREMRLALDCGFDGRNILYSMLIPDERLAAELKEMDARLIVPNAHILSGPLPRRVDLLCQRVLSKSNIAIGCRRPRPHIGLSRAEVLKFAPELAEKGIELGIMLLDPGDSIDVDSFRVRINRMLRYADMLAEETGVRVARICPDAGVGMNYHRNAPQIPESDYLEVFASVMEGRQETLCWNMDKRIADPHGILVTTLLEVIYKERASIYVDTSSEVLHFAAAPRFYHPSILGKEWKEGRKPCDIAGPLVKRNDHFVDRYMLPPPEIGDRIIFHDVGTALQTSASVPTFLYREDGSLTPVTTW